MLPVTFLHSVMMPVIQHAIRPVTLHVFIPPAILHATLHVSVTRRATRPVILHVFQVFKDIK